MSAGELLLEVRAEEIPARMLPAAIQELGSRLFEELMARGLTPAEVESGFTPRRLWLIVRGLPLRERDRAVLEIGPPAAAAFDAAGQPTAAAAGFARKFGVEVATLERRDLSKSAEAAKGAKGRLEGERIVLERVVVGRTTRELLAELLPALLGEISWAKSMRWGRGVGPWVRPVHSIVALFDGEIVPFELFGVAAGRTSAGHPTLSPGAIDLLGADDWKLRLEALGIVPAVEARAALLRQGMESRAAAHGGTLIDDAELLAKLAAICEIPGVMEGALAPELLELPREVLVTSLRDHQSALTVERDGRLLPLFLTVMDRPDDPIGRVRAGNEWVVAARLADARFFWDKDRATRLEARIPALASLGFHQKLGSYGDKRRRLIALCGALAESLGADDAECQALDQAASLAKVDLTTDLVREFTSLQGVMGGVYAREEGFAEPVWSAIYDQYRPASTDDPLPRHRNGRILALADRVDTLVGFFGLGLVPTGSRDPFALRRVALGLLRLLPEHGSRIDLVELVARAHSEFGAQLTRSAEATWELLRPFLEDRLRFLFGLQGFAYDEIEAGMRRSGETLGHLAPLGARIAALHEARNDRDLLAVVLAAKRIANIIKDQSEVELDAGSLELPAERNLASAAVTLEAELERALEAGEFALGLRSVARLAPALEAFFQEVLVMDPEATKRDQRIALLRRLGRSIGRLADLSQLVVDKSEFR